MITRGATGTDQRHTASASTIAIDTATGRGMRIETPHRRRHQGLDVFGKTDARNRAGASGAFHSARRELSSWSDSSSLLNGSMCVPCLSIRCEHPPQPLPRAVQARLDGSDVGTDDSCNLVEGEAFVLEQNERLLLKLWQRRDGTLHSV